ncbi:MAG: hypothetical protein RBU26_08945, partial [Sphaerochaeta sp.]|nr:hypothetical protein [Sphaerochaeta sp.]
MLGTRALLHATFLLHATILPYPENLSSIFFSVFILPNSHRHIALGVSLTPKTLHHHPAILDKHRSQGN